MRREKAAAYSIVIARLDRATQDSRDADYRTEKPRRTGSSAFAEDDNRGRSGIPAARSHIHIPELSGGSVMTLQADFTSQDFFRNPAAAIGNLRRIGPVVEVRFPIIGKVWATTTQALADQVLKDTDTF